MNALAEDIQVLEVEPFIDDIEVSVEGVPYQWRIVPLDGWAMEMLEMRRAALPPEDDAEFKEAIVDLRFWEFAYLLGEDTYQVNTASHIHAAEFVARTYTDSYQLGDGELLVCTVNIPAGVSAIPQEMIDTSERINRTIGIDISDSVTSTRSDVAASSLAVKKAYDLAKSKYTAQDASTTQKGLVQLSSATNSDSETMAATPKAVKSIKDLADTKAPIESPSLTGTPTAPTAAQGTNSTQIANTAFVKAAITALINGAPGTLDTLKEIAAAINNDPNYSTTINNALALKAPLASPALTGVPTAPTAAQGTNNTQIATTAYVRAAISALVGSSPEALDTLNELAAALGNDPNFATTMTNALAGKQPLDATLTALAGLATGANKLPYFTGTDTVSQTDLTSVGRDILAKTSVLAVIQYLGLRELGTSGEKIPLLSTANTWSARQTFNGGITGALTGNADTATKLKTARNINGVRFDGSGDININTLVSRGRVTALEANAQGTSGIQLYEAYNNGYPSPYGNVLHLKGATAAGEGELFIGWSGTSGAHAPVHIRSRRDTDSANWSEWAQVYTSKDSIPGVNAKGDQDTSGMRNVLTALNAAANDFVQMQALSGEAHKQAVTTIVDGIETADSLDKKALAALKDAVDLVRQSKESGQHITDVIAQGDMFSETAPEVKALALFIVANNRSAKRMATAFKLMAQRINDELQHQGQALGDMFGGGDVSLQDILRQVSQELEYEGMQGISGGLFESVSGGSYNGVAPYTSLLLHRASGIKDIIHLIRLLSRTDPQDEQLVQVLAHFVRMPVADVKKWCRLFGISNSLLRGLLNHASSLGRDGFDEIAQAIKNGDMPPAIDWFSIRPTRVKAFLSAAHSASPLAEMVQRLSLIFTDHTALGDLTLDEMKEASIQWADQQNEVNSDFLPAFRKAVSKADDARGILKAFKALQSRVNKHVGDIDGVTAEGRDILKEHGITPEFIDEIRTDMQREVVSSLQIVARALADANPKSAAIVNRVIGDIEASEGIGALKLFLSRAFNPNGNILPGIIGEAKKYVSEEELEQLDQLLKRFSYNPQTRWQMNQRSMGSVHEKVLSAMNSAIANSSVSEEKALEWADSFITEEVEEARAGQNGGIDLRKELADIYRLTGGKISTLSKVVHHQGRAYANLNGVVAVNLNDENASALWHELGHHLEYSNPGLLEKARSFLKANVEGDKPSFVNIGGRGKPEWCFRSRLSNIYMAKVYPPASVSNTGKIRQKSPTISKTSATEVFSMALQLYHDKEAAAASLMNGDGLLELLLGVAKELNNAD